MFVKVVKDGPKESVLSQHVDMKAVQKAAIFAELMGMYHRHEVMGVQNIPSKGSALIALNHSFATYDILLLANRILQYRNRIVRPLMDRWFFKNELIANIFSCLGAAEGNPTTAIDFLNKGEIICVAPGGMREAIRSYENRYKISWEGRFGFLKVAIEAQAPVILAACPRADEIFDVYELPFTKWFYEKFHLPVTLLRGVGLTAIPRPVKLIHYLSEPINPPQLPKGKKEVGQKKLEQFHKQICDRMEKLMEEALHHES